MASLSPVHGQSSRAISPVFDAFLASEQLNETKNKVQNWGTQVLHRSITQLPNTLLVTHRNVYAKIKSAEAAPTGMYRVKKEAIDLANGDVLARLVAHYPDDEQKICLKREFDILQELKGCRGIVRVEELVIGRNKRGLETWTLYEQNCNLGELYDFVRRGELFEGDEARELMADLLEGLNSIHAIHCVHRDLKFENIFLDQKEGQRRQAFIGDFNGAEKFRNENDGVGFEGTIEFMSPEKLTRGHDRNWTYKKEKASDVYALGLILYYMSKGRHLYICRSSEASMERVIYTLANRSVRKYFPEKPPEKTIDWVIYQMLSPEALRPSIADALKMFKECP